MKLATMHVSVAAVVLVVAVIAATEARPNENPCAGEAYSRELTMLEEKYVCRSKACFDGTHTCVMSVFYVCTLCKCLNTWFLSYTIRT